MADGPIPEVYRGVRFRQLAPKLRWFVGPGFSDMKESERPRNENTGVFLDDPEGTFVKFEDDAHGIDIDRQLRAGGLVIEDTNQRRGEQAEKAAAQRMTEGLTPEMAAQVSGEGG